MNMLSINIEKNLEILIQLRKENPFLTHIMFRRDDGVLVDIPVDQAEFKIRNKPSWMIEASESSRGPVGPEHNAWPADHEKNSNPPGEGRTNAEAHTAAVADGLVLGRGPQKSQEEPARIEVPSKPSELKIKRGRKPKAK